MRWSRANGSGNPGRTLLASRPAGEKEQLLSWQEATGWQELTKLSGQCSFPTAARQWRWGGSGHRHRPAGKTSATAPVQSRPDADRPAPPGAGAGGVRQPQHQQRR